MSRVGKYVQTDDERKRYAVDYSDWLDPGEQVSAAVFDVLPITDPVLEITSIQVAPAGDAVQYYVSGGRTGTTYEATIAITTNLSQIKEDVIVVSIREP
jgi:hypothetical protein